jgi:hypothetical protein
VTRAVYLVQLKGGFLSSQRFNYKTGYKPGEPIPFERARIYTRRSDAARAAKEHGGKVVNATVQVG